MSPGGRRIERLRSLMDLILWIQGALNHHIGKCDGSMTTCKGKTPGRVSEETVFKWVETAGRQLASEILP